MPDALPFLQEFLPPNEIEVFCIEQAEAIRVLGKRVIGDIIEIGNRLIAVKQCLDHGKWLPWLEREFGWSERTARNYIAVAQLFVGKSATVTDLQIDVGALYLLAGPSVPEVVREKAVELAEQGECITKALADLSERQAAEIAKAVGEATLRLANDKAALQEEIADHCRHRPRRRAVTECENPQR